MDKMASLPKQLANLNSLRFHISKRYARIRHPFPFPKRTYEERNRVILERERHKRLALADRVDDKPRQFAIKPPPPEPTIRTIDRKLTPLQQELPTYDRMSESEIKDFESYDEYYDPLFNPHLYDKRNAVNPHEEPFNAIYNDSTSGLASEYTKVRNIMTPVLWDYVERLARIKVPPKPETRKPGEMKRLPSGFVPPPETPPDLPYFIPRTRNFLLPVYYNLDSDPEECYTTVKQIAGDLWQLEEELRDHLEKLKGDRQRILTSVQETDARILFRGRHLHEIVDWLHEKGF